MLFMLIISPIIIWHYFNLSTIIISNLYHVLLLLTFIGIHRKIPNILMIGLNWWMHNMLLLRSDHIYNYCFIITIMIIYCSYPNILCVIVFCCFYCLFCLLESIGYHIMWQLQNHHINHRGYYYIHIHLYM